MSIANTNLTNVILNMPKLSQVVPNLARATFRALAPSLAEKRIGPQLPQYATDDLVERLIIPVSEDDPDTEAALEITDHCDAFVKDNDWLALADFLTKLDQSQTAVPSGKRMLEVVLHFLRDGLSELYEAPNEVNFETSFVYSGRLLDAVEAAHLENPDNYMLAAILARLHLDCAWSARGSKPMDELDRPTKSIIRDHTSLVLDVITKFDPIAYNSTLLAEVQYSFVALKDPTMNRLMCAFDDWVELDPANLTPYRHHAFFIHNLHGEADDALIEIEARRAVDLGKETMGSGAYTIMYLQALQFSPVGYTYLDEATFVAGFNDVMQALNDDPVRLIYLLEQVIERFPDPARETAQEMTRAARAKSAKIRLALAPSIREQLGHLYSVAWDLDETEFLHAVAPSFEEELSRGASVEITEGGVLVTEPAFSS